VLGEKQLSLSFPELIDRVFEYGVSTMSRGPREAERDTSGSGLANGWFRAFAQKTAETAGRSYAFLCALLVILAWGVTGPLFRYSDTWQLVINTGTTIVTFLMVFLIQNTQNRDSHAVHLKLDELIRANANARNGLLGLESMTDDQLAALQSEFEGLRDKVARVRRSASTVPREETRG
jgi:low affinity Fe/Cu permease